MQASTKKLEMARFEERTLLVQLINHVAEGHVVNLMQPGGAEALADHLIANGVTVQRWISEEDRLPEEGVNVLVCDVHNDVFIAEVCRSKYFPERLYWRNQNGSLLDALGITHWMHRPEPPKNRTTGSR